MAKIIRAVGKQVVIVPGKPAEKSDGGIVLPDQAKAKTKPTTGVVHAIGDGVNKPLDGLRRSIGVGDEVVFGHYTGTEIKVDGVEYIFMNRRDILAVLEPAP